MFAGTESAYALARKHGLKVAFGTDTLSASDTRRQNAYLSRLLRWHTSSEIARMATSGNAALLALSGERSPYRGELGIVREGALADLLLVDGDPTADIRVLESPERTLRVIMKDGRLVRNAAR